MEDIESRVHKRLEFFLQNLAEGDKVLLQEGQKGAMECQFGKTSDVIGSNRTNRFVLSSSSRDSNDVPDHEERKVNVHEENLYSDNSSNSSRSANFVINKMSNEVEEVSESKISSDGKYGWSLDENGVPLSTEELISRIHDSVGRSGNSDTTNDAIPPVKNAVSLVTCPQKRKRKSSLMSEMLNWLSYVAKHSDDPAVGSVPDCSKWEEEGDEEFWYQVLLVRKVLSTKRCVNSDVEQTSKQKKLKMHPLMYEDVLHHQSLNKSRSSQRPPMIKSPNCSCCNSVQTKIVCSQKIGTGDCMKEPLLMNAELPAGEKTDDLSMEESREKQVSVGPLFQAEVPEWTGEVVESDSKWLGERMWPLEDAGDKMVIIDLDPVGRGRSDECDCLIPNSTECVRFHIAEKRLKLKRELGSLFYKWKFNQMGEEVSLSWTIDEENKFKEMLRLHSASTNKFWNNAPKYFPSKSREMLVRYYFNVFLIQRRSYQNRATPKDIDSDDDEKEFGCVGGRFGYNESTHCPYSSLPICLENKQCTDFE